MIPLYAVLNHVLHQNDWAVQRLQAYAGTIICFKLPLFYSAVRLLENGYFAPAAEKATPDVTISLSPAAALRYATGQSLQNDDYQLDGNVELATEIGKVLQQMEWEYEEDLSQIIGDIPARQLVDFFKRTVNEGGRQMKSLADMFSDYWLEEQPLIAKQHRLDQFSSEVDSLRNDVERLEKRLKKLEKSF